jgi:hypothetical protein
MGGEPHSIYDRDIKMADAKQTQLRLAERLLEKTRSGEVVWGRTPDDDAFQASFKGYAVQVGKRRVPVDFDDSQVDYFVRVLNEDGETVDEFIDTDFTVGPAARAVGTTMKSLHELARRRVLGADQALDAILGQLGD